jgi:predicted RNase H-related nuclease YkuK (DUF458 family)
MLNSWYSGSGIEIEYNEMIKKIKNHVKKNEKLFIGTDSQLALPLCTFATAICLYSKSKGGTYFFRKQKVKNSKYNILKIRMLEEVHKTIDVAFLILEENPAAQIEIHIDIGSTVRSKTRIYVDELKGWVSAAGFDCKIKPNAWASASIADRHSK